MSKRTKMLLRENNAWEKKMLSQENQQVMTDIVVYIRSSAISEYEQEVARRDIMAMLAEGQVNGRTAAEVIGCDMQGFCDEVINALPPRSAKEQVLDVLREGLLAAAVLAVFWTGSGLVEMIAYGNWPYMAVTVGDVLSQVFIFFTAFFIFRSISRHAFDNNLKGLFLLVFIVLALSLLASLYLTHILFHIHILLLVVLMVLCYIGYKLLDARVD